MHVQKIYACIKNICMYTKYMHVQNYMDVKYVHVKKIYICTFKIYACKNI